MYASQQLQQQQSVLDAEPVQAPASSAGDLLSQLQQPAPQLELQLGPQEVQVQSIPPPTHAPAPGDTCSHSTDIEVVPPLGTDQPGEPPKQQQGIREVQVSMALMDEFLKCGPIFLCFRFLAFPPLCEALYKTQCLTFRNL